MSDARLAKAFGIPLAEVADLQPWQYEALADELNRSADATRRANLGAWRQG